jgi:hypothetical protein
MVDKRERVSCVGYIDSTPVSLSMPVRATRLRAYRPYQVLFCLTILAPLNTYNFLLTRSKVWNIRLALRPALRCDSGIAS